MSAIQTCCCLWVNSEPLHILTQILRLWFEGKWFDALDRDYNGSMFAELLSCGEELKPWKDFVLSGCFLVILFLLSCNEIGQISNNCFSCIHFLQWVSHLHALCNALLHTYKPNIYFIIAHQKPELMRGVVLNINEPIYIIQWVTTQI